MTQIVVILPWPSKHLSPNARPTRREKVSAVRGAREAAYWLTREAMGRVQVESVESMAVEWLRPQNRGYDDDNLIARFKAQRDGIAKALGVDDKHMRPQHSFPQDIVPGGAVRVTIEAVAK